MGSSLSSSSPYPSSSYPSDSYSVPGSFDQPRQSRQQDQTEQGGQPNQEESSTSSSSNPSRRMASGPKVAPPIYERDPQPQRRQQRQQPEVVTEQPPRYSGVSAGAPMNYRDSRYDYGMRMCWSGRHDYRTEYGLAGILCAIFCFPCGLLGLCIDVEHICRRCGARRI